jgi:hypothetical protein
LEDLSIDDVGAEMDKMGSETVSKDGVEASKEENDTREGGGDIVHR